MNGRKDWYQRLNFNEFNGCFVVIVVRGFGSVLLNFL